MLGWFGKTLHNRITETESRLNKFDSTCVTRDDLRRDLGDMRAERDKMHIENKEALSELRDDVRSMTTTLREVAIDVASISGQHRTFRGK